MNSLKQEIQFIFSKDAPIQKRSNFIAIFATLLFWILVFIFLIFMPTFSKTQKYETVQIVLSEPTKNQPKNQMEEPKKQENNLQESQVKNEIKKEEIPSENEIKETPVIPKQEEKTSSIGDRPQSVQKTTENVAQGDRPLVKTEQTSTGDRPLESQKSTESVEYALDPMEAFAKQTAKSENKEFNWSKFDENSENSQTQNTNSQSENYVVAKNVFEGTAGETSSSSSYAKTSSQVQSSFENNATSEQTSSALGKIANTKYVGNSSSKVISEATVESSTSSNGKVQIKTSDGRFRALIEPQKPIINISDENAPDGSRNVTILFKIQPNGHILTSDVSITPAAILSDGLKNEIISQIALWRFEETSFLSEATFEFKIVKK